MSLIASALAERRERRELSAQAGWKKYIEGIITQLRTSSGVSITPEAAMAIGAFYDCCRVIAEDCAKLPLKLYRRLTPRGKEPASDHPYYSLLHRKPNPYMTAFDLREAVTGHMAGRGNGYLFKVLDGNLRVLELWPLRPDKIQREEIPAVRAGQPIEVFYYYTRPDGQVTRLSAAEVIHLHGFSFDGRLGYDPAFQARETLGLAAAAERYSGLFYSNDATPRVVLKHPKAFKAVAEGQKSAADRIRESWEGKLRGLDRTTLLAVLEEGMDIQQVGVDPEKSQLIASMEFSVPQVCRWFRMPPHKIGHLKEATYSNIEQQALEYVVDTQLPWLVRWEQRLWMDILSEDEQPTYFWEHQIDGQLRGEFKNRMDGYRVGREMGLYSVNDLLELENRNPIGPEGDVRHVPWNWTILSTAAPQEPAAPAGGGGSTARDQKTAEMLHLLEDRNQLPEQRAELNDVEKHLVDRRVKLRDRHRPLLRSACQAVADREANIVAREAKRLMARDQNEFRDWLRKFYEEHRDFIREKLLPILLAYARSLGDLAEDHMGTEGVDAAELDHFVEEYLAGENGRASWYADKAFAQLLATLERSFEEGSDPVEAIETVLEQWRTDRADRWAELETIRAGGAFFTMVYNTFFGITRWRWHARGSDSCGWCQKLDGRTVATTEAFISQGQEFEPNSEGHPLVPSYDVHHEPAHAGCECVTLPELEG